MNYKKFINKIELVRNKNSLSLKRLHAQKIKKNSRLIIGYYEHDKEEIRLEQYHGICSQFKAKGINTKLIMNARLQKVNVKLNFFFYNPHVFDLKKF